MQVRRLSARSILALVAALALIALTSYAIIIPVNGKAREIPLAAIYTTSGQEGTKPLNRSAHRRPDGSLEFVEPYGAALNQIYVELNSGLSNVFLVRARDINEAVSATACPTDVVHSEPEDQVRPSAIWLVAYFGTTGSPPGGWSVQSVVMKRKTIRVNFLERASKLKNLQPYFVWVPLDKLQPNSTYTLELFDVDRGDVTLSRRVRLQ